MRARTRNSWIRPIALALALASSGCDYFRPAAPEPPTGSVIIPDYSDPDRTLQTIADAIADKARTNGLSAYTGAFAESTSASTPGYHHFFWPDDVSRWTQTSGRQAPDWSFGLEQNFYVHFVNLRGDAYRLQWVPDDEHPDDVRETQASIHRRYQVTAETADGTITSILAVGFADLTFYRASNLSWRITRWEDRTDPAADPSDPEQVTLGRRRLNSQ